MVQVVLLIAALVSVMLGMFVYFNNRHSTLFKGYLVFSVMSAAWIAANAFSIGITVIHQNDVILLTINRLITPFSLFALLSYWFFIKMFREGSFRRKHLLYSLPSVIVASLSFTHHNVYVQGGVLKLGDLYPFYLAAILFDVILVSVAVFGSVKHDKYVRGSDFTNQLTYLRVGTVATLIPALIFGAVVPLFSASPISNIAPFFTIIFLITAAVAMIRHHLFDLRIVVARAIGYGFSVALIAAIYGFLVFGSAQLLFGLHVSTSVQIILSIITGVAGLVFHSLRNRFNRLTNTVLYRDAYDAEDLFNSLNTTLVSSLNLEHVMRKTSGLLAERLKVSYVSIAVRDSGVIRIVGSEKHGLDRAAIEAIEEYAPTARRGVVSTDYLETPETHALRSLLEKHNIALLVPLSTRIGGKRKGLGYIILGPKRSGSFYTNQDSRVLETVANELILAIQNALHFEEIQRFNITLQAKVDDATRKLRKTNHKLHELDETKDDFISMASHQLRTPLTSVKGYISMVLEGDAGKITEAQQKMLRQSYTSSQRMVYLISDLLNVSRLKTGKFVVEPKPTSLPDLVQEEIGQLVEAAKLRSIELTYKAPANFPKLMLDETKTRQVIMNFIDNAIYYTPVGGHIKVSITEKSGSIELTVTDDGIGVPKAENHHLFTKFYRAKNAQRARPDGTGLGLFMAKKVIVAQGGAVLFASQEGKGSTFGFTFSKSKLKVPA